MRTSIIRVLLVAIIALSSLTVKAQTPYAVLSKDGKTLSFYYDNNRGRHSGTKYDMPTSATSNPAWASNTTVTNVVFMSGFRNYHPTSLYKWFYGMTALKSFTDLDNLSTDKVTSIYGMFWGCKALTSLDLTNWDTSSLTTMQYAFFNCSALATLNISTWDISNVTNCSSAFSLCSALKDLYIGTNDFSDVSSVTAMFNYVGGSTPCTLHVDDEFDISVLGKGTQTNGRAVYTWSNGKFMLPQEPYVIVKATALSPSATSSLTFNYDDQRLPLQATASLSKIYAIDINATDDSHHPWTDESWQKGLSPSLSFRIPVTSVTFSPSFSMFKPTNTSNWFRGLTKLSAINGLEHLNLENDTSMQYMFYDCAALKQLDFSKQTFKDKVKIDYMLSGCNALEYVHFGTLLDQMFTFDDPDEGSDFYGVGSTRPCQIETWEGRRNFLNSFSGGEMFSEEDAYGILNYYGGRFLDYLINEETEDYSADFRYFDGTVQDVIVGRPFSSGKLNTICLPFDVPVETLTTLFGAGYQLLQLYDASTNGSKLTLYFTPVTTGIKAGTPYLLTVPNNVEDLFFENVMLNLTASNPQTITYDGGTITFHGVSFPKTLTNNDKNTLFFKNGTLYYPSVSSGTPTIYGMRGYFTLQDANAKPAYFDIKITDSGTTGIHNSHTTEKSPASVFNLYGQKVNHKYKGLVISGSRKYICR